MKATHSNRRKVRQHENSASQEEETATVQRPPEGDPFRDTSANFWRARSRLYQHEMLQENMRLTAFFKLYKI